jgi:hypothetical protein
MLFLNLNARIHLFLMNFKKFSEVFRSFQKFSEVVFAKVYAENY